nr:RNA polymerase subunit beta - 2 [Chlorogonium euchlorum]
MKNRFDSRIQKYHPFSFSLIVPSLWNGQPKGQSKTGLLKYCFHNSKITVVKAIGAVSPPPKGQAGFGIPFGRTLSSYPFPRLPLTSNICWDKAAHQASRLQCPSIFSTSNGSNLMYTQIKKMALNLSKGSGQIAEGPSQVEILPFPSLQKPFGFLNNPLVVLQKNQRQPFGLLFRQKTPLGFFGKPKGLLEPKGFGKERKGSKQSLGNARNIKEGTRGKLKIVPMEYKLLTFQRSNQDTSLSHKPAVSEGYWVQRGDLLTDCASSVGGELSLGQNILVAYMPWEGYNFEDAILISERLVTDDLYTSVHIERYDIETYETKLGFEQITREIPDVSEKEIEHLDSFGIVKMGSWVEEGDILVGKITPINKKTISSYQKLLYTILEKPIRSVRDSSLRAPKGIKAKVIDIKYFLRQVVTPKTSSRFTVTDNKISAVSFLPKKPLVFLDKPLAFVLSKKPKGPKNPKGNFGKTAQSFWKECTNISNRVSSYPSPGSKLTSLGERDNEVPSTGLDHYTSVHNNYIRRGTRKLQESQLKKINQTFSYMKLVPYRTSNSYGLSLSFPKKGKEREISETKASLSPNQSFSKAPLGLWKGKRKGETKELVQNSEASRALNKFRERKEQFSLLRFYFLTHLDFPKYRGLFRTNKALEKTMKIALSKPCLSGGLGLPVSKLKFAPGAPLNLKKWRAKDSKKLIDRLHQLDKKFLAKFFLTTYGPPEDQVFARARARACGLRAKARTDYLRKIETIHIYLAEKRKIQVGDKMAGRHGNKGIVSQILPIQDMPYLPDGTSLDMVLNPLGVPSRMNVGQIYECLLGLAGKFLGENYKVFSFDESYGPEASRSFVFNKLYQARCKTGFKWLFDPNAPGKISLYDGRTGDCFDQKVTVGQAYMLRLVHMVDDKIHCLTPDHEILTSNGWQSIVEINTNHSVATLNRFTGELVYQKPTEIFHYPNYKGVLYCIKNTYLDLVTTLNHRMLVRDGSINGASCTNYQLIPAEKIIGQHYSYLKTANWTKKSLALFTLPSVVSNSLVVPAKKVDMPAWLKFFGLWIAEGWVTTEKNVSQNDHVYQVNLKFFNLPICSYLTNAVTILGYSFKIIDFTLTIHNKQLWSYLKPLSLDTINKSLPSWVWDLSKTQARLLLHSMCLGTGTCCKTSMSYYTSSIQLADDVMRLALHAGWSGNKYIHSSTGVKTKIKSLPNNQSIPYIKWQISIIKQKNNPDVNFSNTETHNYRNIYEEVRPYEGSVYCLSVPNEVFYVRRNGLPVWTGNSRSTGPYSLVTQQPLRGRSKQGGQRLGEMEVWAIEGYGAAFTLLEMLTIKSDDMTGRMTLWSNLILNKEFSIGTPESFKVLICELQALCLDIGLFRYNEITNINNNINQNSLREITSLINLR